MTKNGAVVEFFTLGLVDYVIPAYYIIASAEASSNLARFDGVKYGYRAEEFEGLHDMYKKIKGGRIRGGSQAPDTAWLFCTELRILRCVLSEGAEGKSHDKESI